MRTITKVRPHPAIWLALLIATGPTASCGISDWIDNRGFDFECKQSACDWQVVEGQVSFDGWHPGDAGADLSGPGRAVIEQQATGQSDAYETLVLAASIARDPSVSLRFELEWYATSQASGWGTWPADTTPSEALLSAGTQTVEVEPAGVFRYVVRLPPRGHDADRLTFRIVKEGNGRAVVDELALLNEDDYRRSGGGWNE